MLALRYEDEKLQLKNIPALCADEREATVRVRLAGICRTDIEITRGYAGFEGTLGHEFVGVIEELPPASHNSPTELVGRRVVGEINAGCGRCAWCQAGDARHCPQRTVLGIKGRDGAFAQFLKLPLENLLVVPDEISNERAVFTEPLAAACGIVERVPQLIDEGSDMRRVVVIGDGKLGLLCAQALQVLTRADVTLIGKHKSKLEIAARRGIETRTADEIGAAKNLARAFDCAVEATGNASGFNLALEFLRPRGALVLKSTFQGATDINAARIVVDEISVVGSRCGRFAPALELLARGSVDVESLISDEFALADGVRAFRRAGERGALKVLLRP
jgi:threonine dehydrogenase-like Zn-dependent dehydrogenase